MTSTIEGTATEERTGAELFDADGHVMEDVPAIIEQMDEPWRTLRQRNLAHQLFQLHGMSIFPPLGYLSTIPVGGSPGMQTRGPKETGLDPESWTYFLEAVGIQRTVLYPTLGLTTGRLRDLDYAIAVTRAWNDWMADTYLQHPSGRFQSAALLPLQVPSAAAEELERAVKELGFCSAVLPAHGLPNHLGSDVYSPVYEKAQELDVGLACHGGVHDGFGFDDFNAFAPVHALGFPFSLLISLGGMLSNGVFERFPGLRVAYLEGGSAWILLAAERFSESFKAARAVEGFRAFTLPHGTSMRKYLAGLMQEGRIVLGCEGGEDQLANAIEYFECAPFMYSSDFPHEVSVVTCKEELEELNELPIDDESKRRLRGGTAREFYKL
jgi:predicted TIM-barrel fold metal-dependent hydrolase